MEKSKKILYKIFNITFFISFLLIFFNIIYYSETILKEYHLSYMIIATIVILFIWTILYMIINKLFNECSKKKEIIFLIMFFLILTTVQLIITKFLAVKPTWDFAYIHNAAVALATNQNHWMYSSYFQLFPNNIYTLLIILTSFKAAVLVGYTNFIIVGCLTNIIFINISIVLLYLTVKKLYGVKNAVMALILTSFFSAFNLYVPIYYSDTLSILFPIAIIYLYLNITDKKLNNKKRNICFAILPIILFFGMNIKFTVAITFIAIVIDYFLNNKIDIKKNIKNILIFCIIFMVVSSGISTIVYSKDFFAKEKIKKNQIPYTHWLMMGVKEPYGAYSYEDYIFTKSISDRNVAKKENISIIKKRLEDYGIKGYVKFLSYKTNITWSDGTYFAPEKLNRDPLNKENILSKTFVRGQEYFHFYYYFAGGVQYSFLILMLIGTFITIKNNKNSELSVIRLTIFGLMLFLIIWEQRSRYLVNYIPLFIITFIPTLELINQRFRMNNKKKI